MASGTGTLTITTKLELPLDGETYLIEHVETVTAVKNAMKQLVQDIPVTEINLITVAAEVAGATFKDVDFVYIENRELVNHCRIRYKTAAGATVDHKLLPGKSITIFSRDLSVSENASSFASYSKWDEVIAAFDTAVGDLMVFAGEV